MSLTALVWAAMYTVALFGALANPMFGLFGYLLEYFERPSLYWWGKELPDLRWNFTMGAVATAAYLLRRTSLPRFPREATITLGLMVLQAINTTIVTMWAVNPTLSWRWSVAYWKLVVTFMLFSGIVRTPMSLNLVILFQMIGAGYWGWDAMDSKRTRGRLEGVGSGDTLNSNTLAAHLLTIIPLIVIFAATKRPKWMRGVAIVALPFVINLLILCNSRGATLGLACSGLAALFLVRKGLRSRVMLAGAAAAVAVLLLADQQFISRQETISSPEDRSAQTRLDLWRGALRLVADYPLGAGGRGFHILSPRYVPQLEESNDGEGRSSHNTYIQISAEWGVQGLALFVAMVGYTFYLLQRVRRERMANDTVYFSSLGIQLGLIGTLVSAFFSNRFYGESIYWMCGLATALYAMGPTAGEEPELQKRDIQVRPAAA